MGPASLTPLHLAICCWCCAVLVPKVVLPLLLLLLMLILVVLLQLLLLLCCSHLGTPAHIFTEVHSEGEVLPALSQEGCSGLLALHKTTQTPHTMEYQGLWLPSSTDQAIIAVHFACCDRGADLAGLNPTSCPSQLLQCR